MKHYYFSIFTLLCLMLALASCQSEDLSVVDTEGHLELTSIEAEIGAAQTRASDTRSANYIGRRVFVDNDILVLTTMERTQNAITGFSYSNVRYKYGQTSWTRDMATGYYGEERVFWTDNSSDHTFIGYCTPLSWIEGAGFKSGKWDEGEDGSFSGQFTPMTDDPATADINESDYVDFTDSLKLAAEDILLTHSTEMHADVGGLTTTIHFKHALASLRVIFNIQEYSPSASHDDVKTRVSDLIVRNQPWKYKWTKEPAGEVHGVDIPGWGVQDITTETDGKKDLKAWRPRVFESSGQSTTFTFYSLIVPGIQEKLDLDFKVTYPQALDPTQTWEKNYRASVDPVSDGNHIGVKFMPGYTTTIRISLNHEGEPIYIGAEYIDWENVENPDRSELQKVSTYLDISDRMSDTKTVVSIADDAVATKDDATWLYKDPTNTSTVLDIYGNDGTKEKPYIIKTARQFLSFAYEVKSGRSFKNQYINLEAGIYLQPSKNENEFSVLWPGIGDAGHVFDGNFNGNNRIVKYLKGKPLFMNIGKNAHIDQLSLEDVVECDGHGAFADVNNGTICASKVGSFKNNPNGFKLKGTTSADTYSGSFCGTNNGTLVTCYSTAKFETENATKVGGLVGKNTGTIVVSYAAGTLTTTATTVGGVVAENTKDIIYSFYDKDLNKAVTSSTGSISDIHDLSTIEMQKESLIETLNTQIQTWAGTDEHNKARSYSYQAASYPVVH